MGKGKRRPHGNRDRCTGATNRSTSGDTALQGLREALSGRQKEYASVQDDARVKLAAYEEAQKHFNRINDKNDPEGNPQKIQSLTEELREVSEKMEACTSDPDILQYNFEIQELSIALNSLNDETRQADDIATARKEEHLEAKKALAAAARRLMAAKVAHDDFFIDRTPGADAFRNAIEVLTDGRTGKTDVRASSEKLPKLLVSFNANGSVVQNTENSFLDFLRRELPDAAAAD